MTALYSHTTRAAGTILTASIYNADHQNHINNGVPAQLDDYSTTVAEMQTTTDPGEVGTEVQATSMAGEFERLRFAILEIKRMLDGSVAQWYSTPFAGVDNSGRPPLPPWYIQGLDIQVMSSSPGQIEVATGWARSANDTMNLKITTARNRSVSSLWVSYTAGVGGMGVTFTGARQQAYIFVFKTQSSGYDIGFDTALTASNLLARASASDARRIGVAFAPTALNQTVRPMLVRDGDHIFTGTQVHTSTNMRTVVAIPTTLTLVTVPCIPTGFSVKAHIQFGNPTAYSGDAYMWVLDYGEPTNFNAGNNTGWVYFYAGNNTFFQRDLWTSPCGDFHAVGALVAGGPNASGTTFKCIGFYDKRGPS